MHDVDIEISFARQEQTHCYEVSLVAGVSADEALEDPEAEWWQVLLQRRRWRESKFCECLVVAAVTSPALHWSVPTAVRHSPVTPWPSRNHPRPRPTSPIRRIDATSAANYLYHFHI